MRPQEPQNRVSPVNSTSPTFSVTEPLECPGVVEDLNVKGAHRDVVSLVIEVQPIHLSRQGKQRVARPVGVGMMDIDGRLGRAFSSSGTAVVWS